MAFGSLFRLGYLSFWNNFKKSVLFESKSKSSSSLKPSFEAAIYPNDNFKSSSLWWYCSTINSKNWVMSFSSLSFKNKLSCLDFQCLTISNINRKCKGVIFSKL